jgi:hypothetical protein
MKKYNELNKIYDDLAVFTEDKDGDSVIFSDIDGTFTCGENFV